MEPLMENMDPQSEIREEAHLPEKDCCCCNCCDCCMCRDAWSNSKGKVYCCCCALQYGILSACFLAFFVAVLQTMDGMMLFFNGYVDWYYPVLFLLLLGPLYYACYLFIVNSTSKASKDREQL